MSTSLPLFTLQVVTVLPAATGTRHLHATAMCRDGHEYAVKWATPAGVAASEWLGYRVAHACQIAVPMSATIEDADGKLGFGSRWDATAREWGSMSPSERLAAWEACAPQMSAVIALDIFIGNIDRHANNFLYVRNRAGAWAPLCIDYSSALFARGFPDDPWPMAACNTLTTQQAMKTMGLWDAPSAVATLTLLQQLDAQLIGSWMQQLPPGWLQEPIGARLTQWWGSEAYHTRLQQCFTLL